MRKLAVDLAQRALDDPGSGRDSQLERAPAAQRVHARQHDRVSVQLDTDTTRDVILEFRQRRGHGDEALDLKAIRNIRR